MKIRTIFLSKAIFVLAIFALGLNDSCKKDPEIHEVIPLLNERVIEILDLKGGIEEYKDIYHYEDNRLTDYYVYLYLGKEKWKEWLRYTFEYPSADLVVETREGMSDSVWFPANKYEKRLSGDHLEEIIFYDYDEGFPDKWRPVRKINWNFDQGRPAERLTYTHPGPDWQEYCRSDYEYNGSLWTGLYSYRYINGNWDSSGCMMLIYMNGNLSEVNVYECIDPGGWSHTEQYELIYDGNRLSDMIVNKSKGDSLVMEQTITVDYDENGNPATYTMDYACCPTEVLQVTYEEGKGNFQQVTQGNSSYNPWPWFPAPVKSRN